MPNPSCIACGEEPWVVENTNARKYECLRTYDFSLQPFRKENLSWYPCWRETYSFALALSSLIDCSKSWKENLVKWIGSSFVRVSLAIVTNPSRFITCFVMIWANQPIHSFLVGCFKSCLQETNVQGCFTPALRHWGFFFSLVTVHFVL